MIKTIIYIASGGAIGSVFRFLVSLLINKYWQHNFPIATLTINILGCIIIGFLISLFDTNYLQNQNLKWLLITGFCGGFTTFSTFGLENLNLMQSQQSFLAVLYIGLSVFLGIIGVWIGIVLGK